MAVRMMKEQASCHLKMTQDCRFIEVLCPSNILRYYSGVV